MLVSCHSCMFFFLPLVRMVNYCVCTNTYLSEQQVFSLTDTKRDRSMHALKGCMQLPLTARNAAHICWQLLSKYKKKKTQIGRMDDFWLRQTESKVLTLFFNIDMTSQRQILSVVACHIKRTLLKIPCQLSDTGTHYRSSWDFLLCAPLLGKIFQAQLEITCVT